MNESWKLPSVVRDFEDWPCLDLSVLAGPPVPPRLEDTQGAVESKAPEAEHGLIAAPVEKECKYDICVGVMYKKGLYFFIEQNIHAKRTIVCLGSRLDFDYSWKHLFETRNVVPVCFRRFAFDDIRDIRLIGRVVSKRRNTRGIDYGFIESPLHGKCLYFNDSLVDHCSEGRVYQGAIVAFRVHVYKEDCRTSAARVWAIPGGLFTELPSYWKSALSARKR